MPLPWPSNRPFKILSLDGGGIRGLYGAKLLAQIEREVTGGEPIARYFDMIAGTSTGGIMALGLGMDIPAARIEKLYAEDGEAIFRQKWAWRCWSFLKLISHVNGPLYDHGVLQKLLYREFGETILGAATTRLVIPAFMAPKTEIAVFKTDHHPDFKNDWKAKVWEVARATSAAPTYLDGHESEDVMFLDGGVWANNPVMAAVVDALSAYDISREQIEVLSIGTGTFPFKITLRNNKRGLWGWRDVIKAAMFLTTDNAHAQAALLLGPERITRLEPVEITPPIGLDDWERAMEHLLDMAARSFAENRDEITKFFVNRVSPREKFYAL